MKAFTVEIKGRPSVYVEKFDTNADLLKTLESRPNRVTSTKDFLHDGGLDRRFYNYRSGEELQDRIAHGVDSDVFTKTVKTITKTAGSGITERKTTRRYDVAGGAVHVGRYLDGSPECMVSVRRESRRSPIVHIAVDVSVLCSVPKEEHMRIGCLIAEAVRGLEKSRYQVKLDIITSTVFRHGKKNEPAILVHNVKKEGQPMNMRRMLFPLVDTAYFRGLGFAWIERLQCAESYDCGLGGRLEYVYDEKERRELYDRAVGKDAVMLVYTDLLYTKKTADDLANDILAGGTKYRPA